MSIMQQHISEITKYITDNNTALSEGSDALIKELEQKIAEMCKHANANMDELSAHRQDVQNLSDYLTRLASHLNHKYGTVLEQVAELNKHKNANIAYLKAKSGG